MSDMEMLRQPPLMIAHFREEDTLRVNAYGLPLSSASAGHPLADAFASLESVSTSVSRMVFVTLQRDPSKLSAPIIFK
jgi:hypothetical protein